MQLLLVEHGAHARRFPVAAAGGAVRGLPVAAAAAALVRAALRAGVWKRVGGYVVRNGEDK